MNKNMLSGLVLIAGCTTPIQIQSNVPGASIYVTDYRPDPTIEPTVYEAAGVAPMMCEVEYFAWDEFYVWASAPGHQTQVTKIRGEIKPGPFIGGLFCFLPFLAWSYGPTDSPTQVMLSPMSASKEDAIPLYSADGTQAGWCYMEDDTESEVMSLIQ